MHTLQTEEVSEAVRAMSLDHLSKPNDDWKGSVKNVRLQMLAASFLATELKEV